MIFFFFQYLPFKNSAEFKEFIVRKKLCKILDSCFKRAIYCLNLAPPVLGAMLHAGFTAMRLPMAIGPRDSAPHVVKFAPKPELTALIGRPVEACMADLKQTTDEGFAFRE